MNEDPQHKQMIADLRYDLRKSLEQAIAQADGQVVIARHERCSLVRETNDLAHAVNPDSELADRLLAQAADALHAAAALIHRAHRPGVRPIDRG